MKPFVEFIGAARTVTGSRHLLHAPGAKVLLDCGLFQGHRAEARARNESLGFAARTIDCVVLSHAHIDHSGALPILCREGFRGPIHVTPATRDLCALMLEDAAALQAADARHLNRRIEAGELDVAPVEPLFDRRDVAQAISQMEPLVYGALRTIAGGVTLRFLDAGHVLGSAISVLDVTSDATTRRLVFTGDLGRSETPILRAPETPRGATTLLLESTYGDREHPPRAAMDDALADIVKQAVRKGGKVLIPSFALERAQEVLFSLKKLRRAGQIPSVPVFVDSPLTANITEVFRRHPDCYDTETRALFDEGHSPFEFDGLELVTSVEGSRAIDNGDAPSIIISASGMCEGGRVLHHLQAMVADPRHSIVLVGYQAQHTLGRKLQERRPRVRIFGLERDVHANVVSLAGFSAHADRRDLHHFALEVASRGALTDVCLVHGEAPAQEVLARELRQAMTARISCPAPGDIVRL